MPKRAITQLFIDRITPPKTGRVSYHDTHQPGLALRISASGHKSWSVVYRVKGNDRQIVETLGTVAAIPSVAAARARALASQTSARAGVNPVAARRAAADVAAANTVASAVGRWLTEARNKKGTPWRPKTAREWRRIFEHDVLPAWGTRPISEIRKGDVLELINDKAARRERRRADCAGGATTQAGKMLTRLRTFFAWAVAHDLLAADPTAGVLSPGKEATRDRVLTDDEIKAFWAATELLDAPRRAVGALLRMLLLTAQRVGEVAGMRWSEIDLDHRTWTIPSARTKNGKAHTVALSALAVEVLSSVAKVSGRDPVFSATAGGGFGRVKRRLDGLMGGAGAPWVLHDLRRTATTVMARLGIAPHVADRVLNHTAGTIRGVAAVYNRFEYLDERRAALEVLGRFIAGLVRPGPENVVALRA